MLARLGGAAATVIAAASLVGCGGGGGGHTALPAARAPSASIAGSTGTTVTTTPASSSAVPSTTTLAPSTSAPSTTALAASSPSVASIDSAICAAAFPNVTDGEHCAVSYLKVSTVNQNWMYAAVGLYNAQDQPESDTGDVIFNLSTRQLIGPDGDGFCGQGTSGGNPVPGYNSIPANVTAGFGLTPCSSQVTTTSSPNLSPTTAGIPFTLASLAGTWQAHEERLVMDTTGTGQLSYADLTLCPSCSFATAPDSTLVFVLTSVANDEAIGRVTASSDPKNSTIGEAVQVTLTAGSPGQLLHVDIGGRNTLPYCNSVAEATSQCGA